MSKPTTTELTLALRRLEPHMWCADIARKLGVSKERIRYILKRATKREALRFEKSLVTESGRRRKPTTEEQAAHDAAIDRLATKHPSCPCEYCINRRKERVAHAATRK